MAAFLFCLCVLRPQMTLGAVFTILVLVAMGR